MCAKEHDAFVDTMTKGNIIYGVNGVVSVTHTTSHDTSASLLKKKCVLTTDFRTDGENIFQQLSMPLTLILCHQPEQDL